RRYKENPIKANRAKLNQAIITHYLANTLLYPYPLDKPILNQYKDKPLQKPNLAKRKQSTISIHSQASNPNIKQQNKLLNQKNNPSHNPTLYQLRIMEYKELCSMLGYSDSKTQNLIAKYLSKEAKNYMDTK